MSAIVDQANSGLAGIFYCNTENEAPAYCNKHQLLSQLDSIILLLCMYRESTVEAKTMSRCPLLARIDKINHAIAIGLPLIYTYVVKALLHTVNISGQL